MSEEELSDTEDEEDRKAIISPPSKSKPPASKVKVEPRDDDSTNNSDDELAAALLTKAVISGSPQSEKAKGKARAIIPPAPPAPVDTAPPPPPPTSQAPTSTTTSLPLVAVTGQLHLFDRQTGLFMMQEEVVKSTIHRTSEGYWLLVEGEKGIWVSQGVEKDMVINFSEVSILCISVLSSLLELIEVYTSTERISYGLQFQIRRNRFRR